jgi:hypothetical protein
MDAYRAFGGAFKIFHDANGIHDDNCVIALMCVGISEGNLGRYDDAEGTLEVALKMMREKRWEGRDEFRMAQEELDTIRARRPVEDAGGGTPRLAEGN